MEDLTVVIDTSIVIRSSYRWRLTMETVKVSPKYQVVIPRAIRESMGISPGEEFKVLRFDNRIELIPVRELAEMRGFLSGIDTSMEREPDRL